MNNKRDYMDHEDFRDVEEGPAFEEWTKGMEQNRPDHTRELDGELALHREDGAVLRMTLTDRSAAWRAEWAGRSDGPDIFARSQGTGEVLVMPLPNNIFYIDILIDKDDGPDATCATVVYDKDNERALVVYSWTFDRDGERRVASKIDSVGVGTPTSTPIERTNDLVGRRAMWVYSDNHAYEHIYLNSGTYAWHCLAGPERSIADVDQTKTYKITDEIYLFFVTETVFPWDGVFVLNFTPGAMTNIGRFFGWDPKPNILSHNTFGARGRILNQTEYVF